MGGDLNLKKSWHPVLMSNQRRVWEEEKKALDERKRTEQRIKELKEERAKEEIQQKLEAAGSRKRIDRVDWMYQGPSSGQVGTTEEMEGYLLGKRRIDGLLKGTEHKRLEKDASEESFMAVQKANTLRDTALKIREDPMLVIKRQEQAAYEAMLKEPVKPQVKKEKRKDKERRRRSPDDNYRRSKIESSGDSVSRHHKRHRSGDDDLDSTRNSERRRYRDVEGRRERRSRSPYSEDDRRAGAGRYRDISPDDDRRRERRRSRDVEGRRLKRSRSRSRSRDYIDNGRRVDRKRSRDFRDDDDYQRPKPERNDDRASRLAAMQQDANALDLDREKRLKSVVEKENADLEADERSRNGNRGDKADFVNGMHRKVGEMGLADRIGRGRQGFHKED